MNLATQTQFTARGAGLFLYLQAEFPDLSSDEQQEQDKGGKRSSAVIPQQNYPGHLTQSQFATSRMGPAFIYELNFLINENDIIVRLIL